MQSYQTLVSGTTPQTYTKCFLQFYSHHLLEFSSRLLKSVSFWQFCSNACARNNSDKDKVIPIEIKDITYITVKKLLFLDQITKANQPNYVIKRTASKNIISAYSNQNSLY